MAPPAFLSDFDPFPLTTPSNIFVTEGGFTGFTEQQARRAVALAVEDTYRAIDVGDPARTVRIAIHLGSVPSHLGGQRFDLVFAQPIGIPLSLLGQAKQGVFNNSEVTDTIVAVTYLNEIDALGSAFLPYDTAEGVVNTIAGVAAHEIGHVFDAVHVTTNAAEPDPMPLMATENTGLPTDARLTERRFSATKPLGVSNADRMVQNAGTVARGDFNLDALLDGLDLGVMFANWGMSDRLYHEGDATGDHLVDMADFGIASENWTPAATTAVGVNTSAAVAINAGAEVAGTAIVEYHVATGEIVISVDGVNNWYVESASASMYGASNALSASPTLSGNLTNHNKFRVGESSFSNVLSYSELSLGDVARPGLPPGDLQLLFNAGLGQPIRQGAVIYVPAPEPSSIVLFAGCLNWMLFTRRVR